MGFVSVTCANCAGQGLISVEYFQGMMITFKKKVCNDCDGVGSHLIHAGQVGSYHLHTDPVGTNDDDTWTGVWDRVDEDHPIELIFRDRP